MWRTAQTIGWILVSVALVSIIWIAPGPARAPFTRDVPWPAVIALCVVMGLHTLAAMMLGAMSTVVLIKTIRGAAWRFTERFEATFLPRHEKHRFAVLAAQAALVAFAALQLLT